MLSLLVEFGVDLRALDEEGQTIVQFCMEGPLRVLPKLISLGADINQLNSVGLAPLHIAVMDNKEHVRYLLRHGADPDVLTADGRHCRDLTDDEEILSYFRLQSI